MPVNRKDREETDQYLKMRFGLSRDNLPGISSQLGNFENLDLTGADFSHADLSGANFSLADLSGANFTGSYLDGAKFNQAILSGAVFIGANMDHATLVSANLNGADFSDSYLPGASFEGADLSSEKYEINNTPYQKQTTFERAWAPEANFQNAKLQGVSFGSTNLRYAQFQGATLGIVQFGRLSNVAIKAYSTEFRRSDMTYAALNGISCKGSEVVLGQARLDMADLRNCNLEYQIFAEFGSLWRANLSGSNLSKIWCVYEFNMVDANLENCNLSDALLTKAVFSSSPIRSKGATYTAKTKWPQNFSPKDNGLILK